MLCSQYLPGWLGDAQGWYSASPRRLIDVVEWFLVCIRLTRGVQVASTNWEQLAA